jgi:hypothetical protein
MLRAIVEMATALAVLIFVLDIGFQGELGVKVGRWLSRFASAHPTENGGTRDGGVDVNFYLRDMQNSSEKHRVRQRLIWEVITIVAGFYYLWGH